MSGEDSLDIVLHSLGLHVMVREYAQCIVRAERENWGYRRFLHQLTQFEAAARVSHRVKRLLDQSKIPREFTLAAVSTFKLVSQLLVAKAKLELRPTGEIRRHLLR